jgi:D-alanyl-D-alanine carboxypeptidase
MKIRTQFTAAALLVATLALVTSITACAEAGLTTRIQNALETWVVERSSPEKITGIAAYLSFGDPSPAIEA